MKIYTYSNPFNLTEEPYWDEVREAPHFCVSQTLVQGMNRHYGRHSFNYITTADQVINALYPQWYQSVELKIEQYVSISRKIDCLGNPLARSFKFNQQQLIDALRFAVTLNIEPSAFNSTKLSVEQTAFLSMLSAVRSEACWQLQDKAQTFSSQLEDAVQTIFVDEMEQTLTQIIEEYKVSVEKATPLDNRIYACLEILDKRTELSPKDEIAQRYKSILEHFTALALNPPKQIQTVVFHAIHQFTPKILAAIKQLEQSGIEVIFLLNYQKRYSHVYDTWKKVYEWTGIVFPEDERENGGEDYRLIGECIGNLLQGRRSGDVRLESSIVAYQNKTQFADHVAMRFSDAVKCSHSIHNALSNMEEQFYGVRSDDVNELLKFYFPEQFGDRHFLSYPIGQFILSLYQMWDQAKGLVINDTSLRECLSVNIWSLNPDTTPISIYEKLRGYISDLSEIGPMIERLTYLKDCLPYLRKENSNPLYKEFSFFSLSEYDITYFIHILMDIKNIADELFEKGGESAVDFRRHFQKLIGMIEVKMVGNKSVSQAELSLVKEVQQRLSTLQSVRPIVGNVEDLRQTIHYYLQNEVEDRGAHWIVRNFEQIDGGVLLSRYTQAKTYHFALLSDRNMKQANEEFFPWPITASMLESQMPASQDSDIILISYKEYRNFLRYSVFYGTFFLDEHKHIQFSFVEESDADKDIPYYLLTLLGLNEITPESSGITNHVACPSAPPSIDDKIIDPLIDQVGRLEQETFASCPYRFMLNFVLEESTCFSNPFDSRRLYSLLLFSETWKHNVGAPESVLAQKLSEENDRLQKLFPFWRSVDFIDMLSTARRYFSSNGMIVHGKIKHYDPGHVQRKASFKVPTKDITQPEGPYSPDRLKAYLRDRQWKEPQSTPIGNSEILCNSCNQRNVCMNKYLAE